jgi:DsbC/DsbD-like thiol-disulfide interchange protein
VRLLWKAILTAGLALFAAAAPAAHTRVDLLLSAATARPGDTVMAGVRLKMDPLWHTYWRNSGLNGSCRPASPPATSSGRSPKS